MIYNEFKGKKISALGFGMMRLPCLESGAIDEAATEQMIDEAIKAGVNYFDTAYPYHGGTSEIVAGQLLSKYPRESYYLATKYPGHQTAESYNPAEIFEEQLKKCRTEYFDFYLLHNVCESSISVYEDERWGIIDYFVKQKELGRIKHLGFSAHGRIENMKDFLSRHGKEMEFCQIQLNYLDWDLQDAKGKYELLSSFNIPVWVMEPVRGGRLVKLDDETVSAFKALRPDESVAAWAFRFIQELPNVVVTLSGMSDLSQMKDNLATYEKREPLSDKEKAAIELAKKKLSDSVPCTGCGYCKDGCPMELDIPMLMSMYNEIKFEEDAWFTTSMMMDALAEDKRPTACIGCGACAAICPQNIEIPEHLAKFADIVKRLPSWEKLCKERDEANKKAAAEQDS